MEASTDMAELPQQKFERFDAYNFAKDPEYQAGLEDILRSNPKVSKETLLMAKIFYYSKVIEPIDFNEYKAWKEPVQPLTDDQIDQALRSQDLRAANGPDAMNVPSPVIVGKSMQPVDDPILPYPATFAEIVELIKSGKPIPGIIDIPDKIADEPASQTVKEIQRKPWEEEGKVMPSILDSLPTH